MSDDQLSNTVLLVLANKQDLPQALNGNEVKDKLKLGKLKQKWFLQPCCAKSGEGLKNKKKKILNKLSSIKKVYLMDWIGLENNCKNKIKNLFFIFQPNFFFI